MKKLALITIIFVIVGSLFVACSGSSGGGDAEITIMGNARIYDGEEAAWNELAVLFEEETGIKVNFRWQGRWNEVPQALTTARMAGESVDIVTVGAGLINSSVAASGLLMDITELMGPYEDRFTNGMLDPYVIGDKLWGFPYGNSSSGFFYYNKTMFDELGITSEPRTFAEFVEVSQVIADSGVIPVAFRGKDASYWPNWFFYTYAQFTNNTPIESIQEILKGEASFETQEVIDSINAIKAFYDEGILTPDTLDTNGDGMKALFMQGSSAMMHTHNFQLLPSQVDFELGIIEFPLVTSNSNVISQAFGGPGTGVAIPSFANRDNLDNTMKFIEFMLRPENADKVISCYNPVVDVVKGVNVLEESIVEELNATLVPKTLMYLDWVWPAEVNDAFMQVIPAVVTGNTSAEEGVVVLQESLDAIVAERDYTFDWWTQWTDAQWESVSP